MRSDSNRSIASSMHYGLGVREAVELSRAAEIRRRIRALLVDVDEPPSFARLVGVVDALRGRYRVDAICAELPISPQDYYAEKSRLADLRWRQLLCAATSRPAVAP
jgi:hypothetical protein